MIGEFSQLDALRAAVEQGSFEAAARYLQVSPAAISQRVRVLEHSVGQVLLVRSKPVRTTSAGAVVLRLAQQVDALRTEAAVDLGHGSAGVQPAVRLAVNADSLATWLLPAVASVAGSLVLELVRADQAASTDLLRDGTVMAAITEDPRTVSGCSTRRLGRMRYHPVASATFVGDHFGSGVTPAALRTAPVVAFDRSDDLATRYLRSRGVDATPPTHLVPSAAEIPTAIRCGFGWGMVPAPQWQDEPAGLHILDRRARVEVSLHWQQWRMPSAALASVAEAVEIGARAALVR